LVLPLLLEREGERLLHDCAMAHQRYIFQGSEGRYPLKEEVKVDDGLRKLAFLKTNIKLDNGSE